MPLCITASYLVRPGSTDRVMAAIREYADEMRRSEPGTTTYLSLQDAVNPHRFMHVMVFANESASDAHREAAITKRFTEKLAPELLSDVKFGDYDVVAAK
jgi:quinol monooxygenase YgiN